jgi:hypothetical protein
MAALSRNRLSLFALISLVFRSTSGEGVFSLARTFAIAAQPIGASVAGRIAADGTYPLARVFQSLAERSDFLFAFVTARPPAPKQRISNRYSAGCASIRMEASR